MDIVINLPDTDYSVILTKIMLACPGCKVTELPKGHGRLIDAGALLIDFAFANNKSAGECVHDAPTIIEADRKEQE